MYAPTINMALLRRSGVLFPQVLQKPGQLGITVKFAKSSHGIWIATLAPGLVQDWNDKHPHESVAVNAARMSVRLGSGLRSVAES